MKPLSSPFPGTTTFFRASLVGALVVLVVHVGFIMLAPVSTDLRTAVHDVLVVIEGALASIALFYAARRSAQYSKRLGLAWLLLGIATTSYMIGDAIWTVIEVGLGQSDLFPSLADAGYLPYYLLFIAGILLMPIKRLTRAEGIKLLLDMGIIMIASVLVYRTFLFAPIIEKATDTVTFIFTLAYPAFDLVLLWGVVVVLLRQTRQRPGPLLLLAGSALCLAFADSFFNYQNINGTYESGGSFTDPIYVVSLLLAALAGIWQGQIKLTSKDSFASANDYQPKKLARSSMTRQSIYLLLPYLWVVIAYVTLIWEHSWDHAHLGLDEASHDFTFVSVGVGIIIVLVLMRQLIALRENENLSSDLARMLDVSQILASPLELGQLSGLIRTELRQLIEFDVVAIWIVQDKNTLVSFQDVEPLNTKSQHNIQLTITEPIQAMLEDSQPMWVPQGSPVMDVMRDQIFFATNPGIDGTSTPKPVLSWIAAPLVTNDRRVGVLAIGHAQPNAYEQSHANLLAAFANQAAAAIENAQLRKQEASAAAAAERARLARELHDSVSQALFGIFLGTRTTRQLISTQPNNDSAIASADYVLNLTEGALAEMRALIFELRPENLVTEGLVAALQKQVTSLCKRHNLDAHITATPGEPLVTIEVKEALYRIALEAIQNTIKHAQASEVDIVLTSQPDSVCLEVRDNGKGFSVTTSYDGHYGLISMRERAERCGALFNAESQPGHGTKIRVRVPHTVAPASITAVGLL